MWRFFDLLAAVSGILLLSPVFLVCSAWVVIDDGFPVFFRQARVGKEGRLFYLLKYRSMYRDSSRHSLITVGKRDTRITKSGYFLRKYKLDELPQLLNVLAGDMSLVGPRPEVQKYVALFPSGYSQLLKVRPGMTSPASLAFSNENEILASQPDPLHYYETNILPEKIELDRACVTHRSAGFYFKIIGATVAKVVRGNKN